MTCSHISPVQVVLLQEFEDEKAEELVKRCPVNVFDIEDIANGKVILFFIRLFLYMLKS